MTIVLDASAGVEWILLSAAGQRVEAAVANDQIWVPEHFYVETASVFRRLVVTGDLTAPRAALALTQLLDAPLRRAQIVPMLSEAWTLRDNLTIADSLYVVLARHLGATLVTLDSKLAAAPTIGVATLVP